MGPKRVATRGGARGAAQSRRDSHRGDHRGNKPVEERPSLDRVLRLWNENLTVVHNGAPRKVTEDDRVQTVERILNDVNITHWKVDDAVKFLVKVRSCEDVEAEGLDLRGHSDFLLLFRGWWRAENLEWANCLWQYTGKKAFVFAHTFFNNVSEVRDDTEVKSVVSDITPALEWGNHVVDCLVVIFIGNVRRMNVTEMYRGVLKVTQTCTAVESGKVMQHVFRYRAKPPACRCDATCSCTYSLDWDPDFEKAHKLFENIFREKQYTDEEKHQFLVEATRRIFSMPRLQELCDHLELSPMSPDVEPRLPGEIERESQVCRWDVNDVNPPLKWHKGCVDPGCRNLPKTGCDNYMCSTCCGTSKSNCSLKAHAKKKMENK